MANLITSEKPESVEQYKNWMYANSAFPFQDDRAHQNYYNTMTKIMKETFEESDFWKRLLQELSNAEEAYRIETRYGLLKKNFEPQIVIKPYESFLNKCFRKNVIENDRWPNPPTGNWITCKNAVENFSDLIRTMIIVQYLDGVDFVVEKIKEISQCDVDYQANAEGYYAVHVDVKSQFELSNMDWTTSHYTGKVEIQVTTEIKELIKGLLHQSYEKQRISEGDSSGSRGWQWNYRSNEFRLFFLGHIVHDLEGRILDIREKENHYE